MGIDDFVKKNTGNRGSPGEKIQEQYLADKPQSQWAPYINELTLDILSDIVIKDKSGGTNVSDNILLTKNDIETELGEPYLKGLNELTDFDFQEVCDKNDVGTLMKELNQILYLQNKKPDGPLAEIPPEVLLSVAIQKTLSKNVNIQNQDYRSVTEIVSDLFSNESTRSETQTLVQTLRDEGDSLVELIDAPQMTTQLWSHQRKALKKWIEHNKMGFVDMATATGKTVLGLSTIAYEYGELLPADAESLPAKEESSQKQSQKVLIVADNDMLLEQWRRELKEHMSIPEMRTEPVGNSIQLVWGDIDFRKPQGLDSIQLEQYDLVILDEVHHYVNGGGWGGILERLSDKKVIALSGSVDISEHDDTEKRLQNKLKNKLLEYTLVDAKNDGIIPEFDWEIRISKIAPEYESNISTDTALCKSRFPKYRERLRSQFVEQESELERDYHFKTLNDVDAFSKTKKGQSKSSNDEDFRELIAAIRSRRTQLWNAQPPSDEIIDVVKKHPKDKILVLLNSYNKVKSIQKTLEVINAIPHAVYVVEQDGADQNDTVEDYDNHDGPAILLGVGNLLGEGIDILTPSVCINVSQGSVNNTLLQRIGRVLRKTNGKDSAMFYNIATVPGTDETTLYDQDGKNLVESLVEYMLLGLEVESIPHITYSQSVEEHSIELEQKGIALISDLLNEPKYRPPKRPDVQQNENAVISQVINCGSITDIELSKENRLDENKSQNSSRETDDEYVEDGSVNIEINTPIPEQGNCDCNTFDKSVLRELIEDSIEEKIRDIVRDEVMNIQESNAEIRDELDDIRSMLEDLRYTDEVCEDGLKLTYGANEIQNTKNDSWEEFMDEIRRFRDIIQEPPSKELVLKYGNIPEDIDTSIDWKFALESSGIEDIPKTERKKYTNVEILEDIERVADKLNRPPTTTEFNVHGNTSSAAASGRFGGWDIALGLCGLNPENMQKPNSNEPKYTNDEILNKFEDIVKEYNRVPQLTEFNHEGLSSTLIYRVFDSMDEAREYGQRILNENNMVVDTEEDKVSTSETDKTSDKIVVIESNNKNTDYVVESRHGQRFHVKEIESEEMIDGRKIADIVNSIKYIGTIVILHIDAKVTKSAEHYVDKEPNVEIYQGDEMLNYIIDNYE